MPGNRILRPGDPVRTLIVTPPSSLLLSLGLGDPEVFIGEDPPPPTGAVSFGAWGITSQSVYTKYPFWNFGQAAGMTPQNCVSTLDAYAANDRKCFIRLWNDEGAVDGNGNFQLALWKASCDRYKNAGLQTYINQRAQDGTINCHILMDDLDLESRWGPAAISRLQVEQMAAYSRQFYPSMRAYIRYRTTDLVGYAPGYHSLQGVQAQYAFNRGGIPGSGRIADCTKYRNDEVANAALLGLELDLGLQWTDGGDGTSGIPGQKPGKFRMSAQELRDYADILVPFTTRVFNCWEWDPADEAVWFDRFDIKSSQNYIRDLCDAQ